MVEVSLGEFALRLSIAFQSWQSIAKETAMQYYGGNVQRHGGDELSLRSSLVKECVLQQGFGYASVDIEIEAQDRADIVLYAGVTERRPVAIIETKRSSFTNLLASVQSNGETPVQQLERYLRMRGMHLGALTNGETWHFFDIDNGLEPRASLSLLRLTTVLSGATTPEQVEQCLSANSDIRHALLIAQHMLEASKWTTVEHFLAELNAPEQFHSKSLSTLDDHTGLVQQIRQELAILRDTILAQFTLLRNNYTQYQQYVCQVSETNMQVYTEALQELCNLVTEKIPHEAMRSAFDSLLNRLIKEFDETGDADWFYATYISEGKRLAQQYAPEQLILLPHPPSTISSTANTSPSPAFRIPSVTPLVDLLTVHYRYTQQLKQSYGASLQMQQAYEQWRQRVRGVFASPDEEFCLQTSYVHFVRLFFVRMCEDYHLIQRRISNGPFTQFDEYRRTLLGGISNVYNRLLDETFERATSIYHNFFNRDDLFDWFKLDERTILGLLVVLNRYDFSQVTVDILGTIYNQGYIVEQRRSELGQFYTPHQVVTYMVDSLGIPNPDIAHPVTPEERQLIHQSVIDLSCGSGSFLVEIASRKATILHKLVAQGEINPNDAIEYITNRVVGIDINPFACYLAEINLFIRCMPFLQQTTPNNHPSRVSVNRLNVFCCDTLEPTRREIVLNRMGSNGLAHTLSFRPPSRLTEEEQLIQLLKDTKTLPNRFGTTDNGFDIVIGNPPYVRADESSENKAYRAMIREWGIYNLRTKWDLFVPFVYRNLQFLARNGRMALITSNAIETEGYAADLRDDLMEYFLDQIDFFPKVKLFENVGVHNTIFFLYNQQNSYPAVRQRIHQDATCSTYQEQTKPQSVGANELFRYGYVVPPSGIHTGTIPLCAIVYIGSGLEAHSHEQYDKMVDGKRKKLFDLEESFVRTLDQIEPSQQELFVDRGVVGADVGYYTLVNPPRYVAYDAMKDKMRRPRTPALFRTPEKLLMGLTSGGYYDTEGLFASDSVWVATPWYALHVDDRGIIKVRQNSETLSGLRDLDTLSQSFDLRYVLAIINSKFMRSYLLSNKQRGSRSSRIYPDVWKEMPVKQASASTQAHIATLVDEVQALYRSMSTIKTDNDIYQTWQQHGLLNGYMKDYVVYGQVVMIGNLDKTKKAQYTIENNRVMLYGDTGLGVTHQDYLPILRYFCWYCNTISPQIRGYPWQTMRSQIALPMAQEQVQALLSEVDTAQQEKVAREQAIATKLNEIEEAVNQVYA